VKRVKIKLPELQGGDWDPPTAEKYCPEGKAQEPVAHGSRPNKSREPAKIPQQQEGGRRGSRGAGWRAKIMGKKRG